MISIAPSRFRDRLMRFRKPGMLVNCMFALLVGALSLALEACNPLFTNASDPTMPREQLAVVRPSFDCWALDCVASIVDASSGKLIYSTERNGHAFNRDKSSPYWKGSETSLRLVPGQYSIELHYLSCGGERIGPIAVAKDRIRLEEGHSYKVNGNCSHNDEAVWIEDSTTGEVIAGVKHIDGPLEVINDSLMASAGNVLLSTAWNCFECLVSISDAESGQILYDRRTSHVYPGSWLLRSGVYVIEYGPEIGVGDTRPLYRDSELAAPASQKILLRPGKEYEIVLRDGFRPEITESDADDD